MAQPNYEAEQVWLQEYFGYCDWIDLSVEALDSMEEARVSLPEILDVLRDGKVMWAERTRQGCDYIVRGRNYDDEEIEIHGRFESEVQLVAVVFVKKG